MLFWITSVFISLPAFAAEWYVRPDGGTRYSTNVAQGQCDGKADAPYPGKGVNQHCAFKEVRYLYGDGTYNTGITTPGRNGFPAWGWIGQGGDTYIIHGSIADHVSYRIGWSRGDGSYDGFGVAGDAFGSGIPVPPSGTAARHTRILGGNYGKCHAATARTQLHGGFGVNTVLEMAGASYVDLECLDITDFSACGRSGQAKGCSHDVPMDDYAVEGINWSNGSTHDVLNDIRIHGLAFSGMGGPTGEGVEMHNLELVGNAGSGWNADANNGTTGVGHLLVQSYNISWNGCAEEYPIVHTLPYSDCTDQNSGGYGDGFGTATVASPAPGWQVTFDQGVAAYNTQDGLDALHLVGPGSSMTIKNTLAHSNMGQQIKVGGAAGTAVSNVIYSNCNALRQVIPGTPEGYNKKLSDFCRASDTGVLITVANDATTVFSDNVLYSASATALEVELNGQCDTDTCIIHQQRNIFIGFRNNPANGYPGAGTGDYSNPLYVDTAVRAYKNAGSSFDHNVTFHAKSNWRCPASSLHEKNAFCGDPHLKDESWHVYGYGDTTRTVSIPQTTSEATQGASDPADSQDSPDAPKRTSRVLPMVLGVGVGAVVVAGTAGWWKRRGSPK